MKIVARLAVALALAVAVADAHTDDTPARHLRTATHQQQHVAPKMEAQQFWPRAGDAKMESLWGGYIRTLAKMEAQQREGAKANARMEAAHHNAQDKSQTANHVIRAKAPAKMEAHHRASSMNAKPRANMEGQHRA